MQTQFIHTGNSSIHYYRWGNGPKWLFCFHGYGEEGISFGFLEKQLGSAYTLVAIEMPFHGQTGWKGPLLFEPATLVNIIHQIKPSHQTMQMLGYSMGGRVALQLFELIPSEIEKIILLAPDGLHHNIWQKIATQTLAGNKLFYLTMRYPGWMIWLMDILGKLGLFNKSIIKFVHYYLDDADARTALYKRWTTMRRFKPGKQKIADCCIANHTEITMLFGKYDRVIPDKHGKDLAKKAPGFIRLRTIDAGHQLLREKHALLIAELILT